MKDIRGVVTPPTTETALVDAAVKPRVLLIGAAGQWASQFWRHGLLAELTVGSIQELTTVDLAYNPPVWVKDVALDAELDSTISYVQWIDLLASFRAGRCAYDVVILSVPHDDHLFCALVLLIVGAVANRGTIVVEKPLTERPVEGASFVSALNALADRFVECSVRVADHYLERFERRLAALSEASDDLRIHQVEEVGVSPN